MPSGSGRSSTATIIFTDRVASTEARVALGDEAADGLRRAHDRILTHAVEAHGGTVAGSQGDGLVAWFASSTDALEAAVAAQQGLERFNRSRAAVARLDVRMGLSAGDVSFLGDGTCAGMCVVEAAALCAAARGGQVLVSEVVLSLARARSGHQIAPLGAVDLAGLPEPAQVSEVLWRSGEGALVPLPAALGPLDGLPFVGRSHELERLTRAWKRAAAGCRAAFVVGEPGIGKTRLLSELAEVVHAQGGTVLYGRCHEDVGLPYPPFAEALRTYTADVAPAVLADQLGPLAGDLARLVPRLGDHVPGLAPAFTGEPDTERYRLFEAVVGLLSRIAASAPALVVVDDLHWADRSTLALLRHLVLSEPESRVLIAASFRDTDVRPGDPLDDLVADLLRDPESVRLGLGGLSSGEVGQIVREAARGTAVSPEALAQAIHAQTEGNPFFVAEVLRHLVGADRPLVEAGRLVASQVLAGIGVPEGVQQLVATRLSRMPRSAQEVLALAAVIGPEFDVRVLAATHAGPRDEVLEALELAEEGRMVAADADRPGCYRFAHALVRSSLYDRLPASRRARLHGRLGEVMLSLGRGDQVLEIARHLHAAGPGWEPDQLLAAAMEGAGEATAGVSHELAAACYGMALDALSWGAEGGMERRAELLLARARAWRRAGEPGRTRTDLDAAAPLLRARGDADGLGFAALELGKVSDVWGVELALEERLGEALALAGGGTPGLRARLLARLGQAVFYSGPERRLALSDQALAEARAAGDPDVLADVLCARHVILADPDDLAERTAVAGEIVDLATSAAEPELAATGRAWRMIDRLEAADLDGVDEDLAAYSALAESLRQPLYRRDVVAWRAMRALLEGRFGDSEREAAAARDMGARAGDPHAEMIWYIQQGWLVYDRGIPAEVAGGAEVYARVAEEYGDQPGFYPTAVAVAITDAEVGRREAALARYDLLVPRLAGIPRDGTYLLSVSLVAHLCARFEDRGLARDLHARLVPYAGRLVVVDRGWAVRGVVDQFLIPVASLLGRHDEALAHARAALGLYERIGARPLLARTLLLQARALLAAGDPAQAEVAARAALAAGRALQMEMLVTEAAELLSGSAI